MSGDGAGSYGDLLITSLVVLGGVCVAAYLAVRVLGRLLASGRARGVRMLDIVARMPLEPRRSLYVVDVAGKMLLVGTSEMGLSVLAELDAGEVRSRDVAPRPSFAELVTAAWSRRRKTRGFFEQNKSAESVPQDAASGCPDDERHTDARRDRTRADRSGGGASGRSRDGDRGGASIATEPTHRDALDAPPRPVRNDAGPRSAPIGDDAPREDDTRRDRDDRATDPRDRRPAVGPDDDGLERASREDV